ncbi:MAG: hypothetical protein COY68_02265 [Candidatus Levybacteria bacterium CG_4_10_14_0_8_um_filter_35_23]|nr:MAG: hypothetical protein COY68_02265 [Candidatus Levybacteria bacterium CG_4_10_14_0_8_um_filter_35_23]
MKEQIRRRVKTKTGNINSLLLVLLLFATFLLGALTNQLSNNAKGKVSTNNVSSESAEKTAQNDSDLLVLEKKVISDKGYSFSISWGDLGKKLVEDGVIDKTKLAQSLTGSDTMPSDVEKYLDGSNQKIELNEGNAHFWLNVLWGLGLANKNDILDKGEMQTASDNNPANFASTGGYTLGVSDAMSYYSKNTYFKLDDKQQKLVEEIAGNVYRPCCGNSTAFPDCNHGMAMLALIELMVSQNYSKEQIYDTALKFNALWFPQTYFDIAYHFEKAGRDYTKISSKELLSKTFSSGQGYAVIAKEAEGLSWPGQKSGGSCGA